MTGATWQDSDFSPTLAKKTSVQRFPWISGAVAEQHRCMSGCLTSPVSS